MLNEPTEQHWELAWEFSRLLSNPRYEEYNRDKVLDYACQWDKARQAPIPLRNGVLDYSQVFAVSDQITGPELRAFILAGVTNWCARSNVDRAIECELKTMDVGDALMNVVLYANGCASHSINDLRNFLAELKAKLESLPETPRRKIRECDSQDVQSIVRLDAASKDCHGRLDAINRTMQICMRTQKLADVPLSRNEFNMIAETYENARSVADDAVGAPTEEAIQITIPSAGESRRKAIGRLRDKALFSDGAKLFALGDVAGGGFVSSIPIRLADDPLKLLDPHGAGSREFAHRMGEELHLTNKEDDEA